MKLRGKLEVHGQMQSNQTTGTLEETITSASTKSLTVGSPSTQIFNGTIVGQVLRLPGVTTIGVGSRYWVWNEATADVTVQSNGGTVLFTVAPSHRAEFVLKNSSIWGVTDYVQNTSAYQPDYWTTVTTGTNITVSQTAICSNSASVLNHTLPDPTGANNAELLVKNSGTALCNVSCTQGIDDATNVDIYPNQSIRFKSNGSKWLAI